jgi:hypothetical protein
LKNAVLEFRNITTGKIDWAALTAKYFNHRSITAVSTRYSKLSRLEKDEQIFTATNKRSKSKNDDNNNNNC